MFELRVLSGLYQGASLPLIGNEWQIGASEEDDLAIFEPGMQASAIRLVRQNTQWLCNGVDIQLETPWQMQHVWLVLCHASTPWDATVVPEPTSTQTAPNPSTDNTASSTKNQHKPWLVLALVVPFLSVWAWSTSAKNEIDDPLELHAKTGESSEEKPSHTVDTQKHLDDVQLVGKVLEHMLKERDLAHVVVSVEAASIALSGSLVTEGELQRVDRMLLRFHRQYKSPFPVTNHVKQREFKLPFRITQVTTGPIAHVVTDGGKRLFIGDEVNGIRLEGISDHRITFGGKFKLELTW